MADAASAMTSGHAGALFTIHADSAVEAQQRATMYVAQSDAYRGDADGGRELVRQAFHMCVHLGHRRGSRQRVVDGVTAYESDGTCVNLYSLDDDGELQRVTDSIDRLPRRVARPLIRFIDDVPLP
jgi:Flp pilus assembly CpaF family ATPase